jgi:hypothetical protein
VGEDEEMERGGERGVAKRPDLNELDVPEWAGTGLGHTLQRFGSCRDES